MAAITSAVVAVYFGAYSARLQEMGLKQHKPDKEAYQLYNEMLKHRQKMEADFKDIMFQAKLGTCILIALVLSIGACIADWTGVF